MKVLALDTSCKTSSVAILEDCQLIATRFREGPLSQSETLLDCVQETLDASALTLWDIDLFALTVGPGFFTGLRVGLSTVKGFSIVSQRPVVAVSSLEALALPFLKTSKIIVPCLDARRGEVYAAAYRFDEVDTSLETLLVPSVLDAPTLAKKLLCYSEEKILIGSGVVVYPELIHLVRNSQVPDDAKAHHIQAESVGRLGFKAFKSGNACTGRHIHPIYLRAPDAEQKRTFF